MHFGMKITLKSNGNHNYTPKQAGQFKFFIHLGTWFWKMALIDQMNREILEIDSYCALVLLSLAITDQTFRSNVLLNAELEFYFEVMI